LSSKNGMRKSRGTTFTLDVKNRFT
jgi:hypothetical protein